jgi:predicted transcriptional regulator
VKKQADPEMLLCELERMLELTVLSGHNRLNTVVDGVFVSDILSDVMAKAAKGALWVTNQTNINVVAITFFKGLAGVILPNQLQLDRDALVKAKEKEIPVFSSALSAFSVAGELYKMGLKG